MCHVALLRSFACSLLPPPCLRPLSLRQHCLPRPSHCRRELLTWEVPWGTANPWQLVSHVMAGGRPEVPPRQALPGPDTASFAGLDDYVLLMRSCWEHAPEHRPTFQQIVPALRRVDWSDGGVMG